MRESGRYAIVARFDQPREGVTMLSIEIALSGPLQTLLEEANALQREALALRRYELELWEVERGLGPKLVIESVTLETPDGRVAIKGEITMQQLTEGQGFTAKARPKSRRGSPASVQQGSAEWFTSDPGVATVELIEGDELAARVVAQSPGECIVSVTADADMGEGVKQITGIIAVVVTAGEAAVFELEAGPVEEIEATEPGGTTAPLPEPTPAPIEETQPTPVTDNPAPVGETPAEGEKPANVDDLPQPFNG